MVERKRQQIWKKKILGDWNVPSCLSFAILRTFCRNLTGFYTKSDTSILSIRQSECNRNYIISWIYKLIYTIRVCTSQNQSFHTIQLQWFLLKRENDTIQNRKPSDATNDHAPIQTGIAGLGRPLPYICSGWTNALLDVTQALLTAMKEPCDDTHMTT